jgi:hypothetical protein
MSSREGKSTIGEHSPQSVEASLDLAAVPGPVAWIEAVSRKILAHTFLFLFALDIAGSGRCCLADNSYTAQPTGVSAKLVLSVTLT